MRLGIIEATAIGAAVLIGLHYRPTEVYEKWSHGVISKLFVFESDATYLYEEKKYSSRIIDTSS